MAWVAAGDAQALAPAVAAVVQGELQGRAQVDVGRGGPLVHLARMGHHAAAVVPVPGGRQRNPGRQEHGGAGAVVVDGGEAHAFPHQSADRQQERLGAVRVDAHAQVGLVGAGMARRGQAHVGHRVGGVGAVGSLAADGEVLEGAVAREEAGGVAGDRPDPLRELDPQAVHELLGGLGGDEAPLQVRLEVGGQHLVQPAQVERHGVFRQDPAHLDEPDHLHRFPEPARGLGRHPPAGGGDGLQLGPARGSGGEGQPLGLLGVALPQADDRRAAEARGPVELDALQAVPVGRLQVAQPLLGLGLEAGEALGENDVLEIGSMFAHVGAPLGVVVHHPGVHGHPGGLFGQPGQVGLLQGTAPPEREDLLAQAALLLLGDPVGVLVPVGKVVQLRLDPFPGQLRIHRPGPAGGARVADDELVVEDGHRQFRAGGQEPQGAAHLGAGSGVLPVGPGVEGRARNAEAGLGLVEGLLQPPDPRAGGGESFTGAGFHLQHGRGSLAGPAPKVGSFMPFGAYTLAHFSITVGIQGRRKVERPGAVEPDQPRRRT